MAISGRYAYVADGVDGLCVIRNDLLTALNPHTPTGVLQSQLLQNYPNPYNPETTITYRLSKAARVVMKIYTPLGQEVRTLVNARQSAGEWLVEWDGRDRLGRKTGSGVYIYRMEAEVFVQSRMMLKVQ